MGTFLISVDTQTLSHLTMGASEQKLVAQYRMFKVEIPG